MPAPPGTPDFVCDKKRFFMARCVFQIFWFGIIHLWLSLLITSNADGNGSVCMPSIRVPRNTVWNVRVLRDLTINCTVSSEGHCWKNISVTWCRIDDKNECKLLTHFNHTRTEWKYGSQSEKILFLIFHKITMQDAGLYRCEITSPTPSMSHSIRVTVTDFSPDFTTDYAVTSQENNTTKSSHVKVEMYLQPYVSYICGGTGGLLLIVVVVSVTVIRCRGKKKIIKEKIHGNQSTASPVADRPPPMYTLRQSPRSQAVKTQTLPAQISPPSPSIYDTPPVRVTSLRDRSSAGRHPVNRGSPRRFDNRVPVEEEEEENPLIYATLNHEGVPQRPAQRVAHVQIEASEYAAIKVT